MDTEKIKMLKSQTSGKILRALGLVQLFFCLVIIGALFMIVWLPDLSFKIIITGIIGVVIVRFFKNIIPDAINEAVDEYIEDNKL